MEKYKYLNICYYMKISIVIGYYNRKKQLFYTLKTINNSSYKNIEIIIVDDCSDNPNDILNNSDFEIFNMNIKLISINQHHKTWVNPCVGYNIGIRESTGDIIILQNAEVCHIGDALLYVVNNLKKNNWITLNCYGLNNFTDNDYIYTHNNDEIYKYINQLWKENDNYSLLPGGNNTFKNNVGGWLNHFLFHFVAYHYFGAIFRDDLLTKMNCGFDLDYANGICFDDNDFIKRLILNNFEFKINTFSESEPYVIHLFHEKSKNIIENKEEKWNINKKIYDEKCRNMNITNDWKLCNFMPKPIICNKIEVNYSDLNIVIGIILNNNSEILKIQNNIINLINKDAEFLSVILNNLKINIVFCVKNMNNSKIKECINFWKNKFEYNLLKKSYSKNINIIEYFDDLDLNINNIYKYANDSTMKIFYNIANNIEVTPNNMLKKVPFCKNYYITKNTNLLELQNNFLKINMDCNINLIFNKKNYTNEMNTFRKCILKRYFYKNSEIKIPSYLNINILYN
jgi:glycosyltransferase involved in cell wall biosynthesis